MFKQIKYIFSLLYERSPRDFVKWFRSIINRIYISRIVEYPAPKLSKWYFQKQERTIKNIFALIDAGTSLDQSFLKIDTTKFGERIVEYPYFYNLLKSLPTELDLLDVGCVLNKKFLQYILSEQCSSIWFCNPAIERINLDTPITYHISILEDSFPDGRQFPIVTCFSTIEHIGYDNSQYGVKDPGIFKEPSTEPFIQSFKKLAELTSPGGSLLISFPYGYREVLTNPGTAKISSQVMDYASLTECIPVLENSGMVVKLIVFEATDNGWEEVEPENCNARYANGRPGATAVAILDCHKASVL